MKFGEKLSIGAFKAKHNADKLDVVRNPKTDKLFVSANGRTLASVSKNYDASLDKEFVELIMEDTGETLWCLHNPGTSANVVESL